MEAKRSEGHCFHTLTWCLDFFGYGLNFWYPQPTLVEVFRSSRRVFDLLAEDERQLKQEEVSVPPLPDQRLGLPNQEGVLEQELPLHLQALLQTWSRTVRSFSAASSLSETPQAHFKSLFLLLVLMFAPLSYLPAC